MLGLLLLLNLLLHLNKVVDRIILYCNQFQQEKAQKQSLFKNKIYMNKNIMPYNKTLKTNYYKIKLEH